MEVKKARRADLEKGKSRWLFMGLIVTLSFMFVSFEWTERNVTYAISDLVSDPDFFEELVPVTYNQDKPLPPPPPPAAVNPEELNIVDNNSTETETDIAASDPTDAPVIIPTPIEVPEEVVDENVEFVVVEEMPVFRNGNADLMRYLSGKKYILFFHIMHLGRYLFMFGCIHMVFKKSNWFLIQLLFLFAPASILYRLNALNSLCASRF